MKKLRIGIIYGGRSGEHEVSIASAASVFKFLDRAKYDPVPIRIEKDGRWIIADRPPVALAASEVIEQARQAPTHPIRQGRPAQLLAYPADEPLLAIERADPSEDHRENAYVTSLGLDVVFPVLHGPYGEDGTASDQTATPGSAPRSHLSNSAKSRLRARARLDGDNKWRLLDLGCFTRVLDGPPRKGLQRAPARIVGP